jgi:hypothetical protein
LTKESSKTEAPSSGSPSEPPTDERTRSWADAQNATTGQAEPLDSMQYRGTWTLTVMRSPSPKQQIPRLLEAPTFTGEPRIGSSLEVKEGTWAGSPAPTFSYTWTRNGETIPGANGRTYVPIPVDDRAFLACRVIASNIAGATAAATEAVRMLYTPPVAITGLLEEVLDRGTGPQVMETATYFSGEDLTFTASGSGATIEPATGRLTLTTDTAVSAREITVVASNSGGSANLRLFITVEDDAPPEGEQNAPASVAFIAPTLVQLVVEEGSIVEFDRIEAQGNKTFSRGMDPTSQVGGAGTLDGVDGNFSGNFNTSSPQLFERWAVVESDEWTGAFAISNASTNACLADSPGNWTVTVNGVVRSVTAVHRKTVPIKTRMVNVDEQRRSVRRHVVSLTLASPLASQDTVRVTGPGGAPALEGIFSSAAVTEAIHVCHEGYPVIGPKKAYVGLWLGHSIGGASGSTNAVLSTETPWQLVRTSDGTTVASGNLVMAKPQSASHQNDLNYNGCDIYEADFSSFGGVGDFRLEIPGVGSSPAFPIARNPYAEALRLAARAFFFQRSGCAISAQNGEGIVRPRNGHPEDGLTVWQSSVLLGRTHEGFGSADPFAPLRATPIGTSGPAPELFPASLTSSIAAQGASIQVDGSTITWTTNEYGEISINLVSPLQEGQTYEVVIDAVRTTEGTLQWKFDAGWPVGNSEPVSIANGLNTFTFDSDSAYIRLTLVGQRPWDGQNIAILSISVVETEVSADPAGQPNQNAWGGWHDAADWDRRIQHMEAVYQMAELVESFPSVRTLDLNLPESGKTFSDEAVAAKRSVQDLGDGTTVLPDLIHEALWGISLWRRTQRSDGAIIGGVEYSREAVEGSVSWNPLMNAYAYDVEEWAAYNFAMAAAKLGHVIKTVCGDRVLGDALIAEAVAAWGWAESVFATGIDAANGSGGDPFTAAEAIRVSRVRAAPVVYRAAGTEKARLVWESYTSFGAQSGTGLPSAGEWIGWHPYDYTFQGLDYRRAGIEGRAVNAAISSAVHAWSSDLPQVVGKPIGTDYGLQGNEMYGWGVGWFRFGPGSNWMAGRYAVNAIASESITPAIRDAVVQGMWFALGCNPSNVSLIRGLGQRQFGQHLMLDFTYPGATAVGPAAGDLRSWELQFVGDSLYPRDDKVWPRYTRIFESSGAVASSEFAIHANMMEWLFACAMAAEAQRE